MAATTASGAEDGFSNVFQEPAKKLRQGTDQQVRVGSTTIVTDVSFGAEGQAEHSKAHAGALPTFKACQLKLARTWDSLQRRIARRSAAVHKHNVDDEPLLLAAAEDLPPEAWEQDLQRWPEVAKDTARLRPVSPDSACGDGHPTMLNTSPLEAASSVMAAGTSLLLSTAFSDDGLKTPPYARSPVPPDPEDEFEQASTDILNKQFSGLDAEQRRTEILKAKARKRLFAPPPAPPPPVRDQVIGKLLYLQTCREVMGESRYGFERRRLELQSDVKGVSKYMAREAAPTPDRSEQDGEASSQVLGRSRRVAISRNKVAEDVLQLTSSRHEDAMATFEYQRLCRQHKVTMPILGSFAVHTHKEPTPLCADNWSLGDAPLVALAKSPWRKALAAAGHCRLRGNRLTNDGVAAVIKSLGAEIATLDLADNLFDAQGAKVLADFVHRGAQQLRVLDVSRNRLDDRTVALLLSELHHECHHLLQLGFADVQMGAGFLSGPAMGTLVQGSDSLAALNVSYNMLQGEAAEALLNGVYENGTNGSGMLRHLDLSWNCFGQGPMKRRVAQKLGAILRDGRILLHLDVSFNQFGKEGCAILAEGIQDNHTLWGLHMDGNCAMVDADGFIRILDDIRPESCFQGAPAPSLLRGKQAKKKKKKPKPKPKRRKRKGALGQEEAWRSWLQQDARDALTLRDFGHWQKLNSEEEQTRDAERALFKFGVFQGLCLPEELCENPGHIPTEGLQTRMMPPRMQEDWLQALSSDIREEFRAGWTFGNNISEGNLGGFAPIRRCRSPPTRERSSSPGRQAGTGTSRRDQPGGGAEGVVEPCVAPSCWLCNGWVEVPFILTPGISNSEELAFARFVCAFVSLDNFARPSVLKQGADGRFEGSRFLPPVDEPMLVVFQVDSRLEVANDLPSQKLAKVLRIALFGQGGDRDFAGAAGGLAEQGSESAAPIVRETEEANLIFVAHLAEARLKELDARDEPLQLSKVPEELRLSKAPPRRGIPAVDARKSHIAPDWALCTSVWALHPDIYTDKMNATFTKCFERDWQLVRTKLSNKRSLADIDSLRAVLHKYYPALLRGYQKLSTVHRNDKDPGITLGVYTNTLSDSHLLAGHQQFNANYFDSVFAASGFVPKDLSQKATIRCADGLVRWQFLEMIVRLGEACRVGDLKAASLARTAKSVSEIETMCQAVARVVSMHYGPMAQRDEEELKKFRKDFFVERVDKIFRRHLVELKTTYEFFTDSGSLVKRRTANVGGQLRRRQTVRAFPRNAADNRNTMSRVEWQVYLEELKVIDSSFPDRLVPYAFSVGAALNPNEACSSKHLELSFVEFLVALGFVLWVRAGRTGGTDLEENVEMVFTVPLMEMNLQTADWQSSPLLAKLRQQSADGTPLLRKLGVSPQWLHEIHRVLQRLISVADDNLDGKLSLMELRSGFAQKDIRQDLQNLGVGPAHLEEFYKALDIECHESVTLARAIFELARVKDRLKRFGPALAFFSETFSSQQAAASPTDAMQTLSSTFSFGLTDRQVSEDSNKSDDGEVSFLPQAADPFFKDEDTLSASARFDPDLIVSSDTFKKKAADSDVQEQMRSLGIACSLMDLWDFLESEGWCFETPGARGSQRTGGRAVRLGAVLAGYVHFSDPMHTNGRARDILERIFNEFDEDGSGSISRNEWLALIGNQQLLKKMHRMGLLSGFEFDERALEESMSMLFHRMDQDSSGTLTIDEVVAGFLEQWHLVRQRSLEATPAALQPVKPSDPAPGAMSPRRPVRQRTINRTQSKKQTRDLSP